MSAAISWLAGPAAEDDRAPEHAPVRRRQPDGWAEPARLPTAAAAGNAALTRLLRQHAAGSRTPAVAAAVGAAGNAAVTRLLRGGAVQRSALTAQGAGPLDDRIAAAIAAERGGGAPLAAPVRAEMERHLGVDLGTVRIHTGPTADTLNRAVTAEAFTSGADVFITSGRYDPGSASGRELLAHELTHVVQQSTGTGGAPAEVSHPDDPAEAAARSVGRLVGQRPVEPVAAPDEPDIAAGEPVGGPVGDGVHRHHAGPDPADLLDDRAELPLLGQPAGGQVQRCGPIPAAECPCHGDELAAGTHPPVQRAPAATGEPAEQEELDAGRAWQYRFDGCSVPSQVAAVMGVQWGSFDKDNPAGGKDTQFAVGKPTTQGGVACDRHDECYQSCGTDKFACDERMHHDMREICAKSSEGPQVKALCNQWAEVYFTALRKFGQSAFDTRKQQVCGYDRESLPPAFRYPPRELLRQGRGGRVLTYLEYTVMQTFPPLSAYQLIESEDAYQRYLAGEPDERAEQGDEPAPAPGPGPSTLKMR